MGNPLMNPETGEAKLGPKPTTKEMIQQFGPKVAIPEPTQTQQEIAEVCDEIKELLLEKNRSYGDSALNPRRIFSKADTMEQLYVRIDDKLSRLLDGYEFPGDSTIDDLLGYFVLLKILIRRNKGKR